MSKTIKLIRPIKNAAGTEDINQISIKDADDISASDFYDMKMSSTGIMEMGDFEPAICNLCGLTSSQVATMHIKDYIGLTAEVGKHIL